MVKPEIRAVKKDANQSKEPSQKQETQPNESVSKVASAEETPSSSHALQKPNEQQKAPAEPNQEPTTLFLSGNWHDRRGSFFQRTRRSEDYSVW